jgi:hypothetical protein
MATRRDLSISPRLYRLSILALVVIGLILGNATIDGTSAKSIRQSPARMLIPMAFIIAGVIALGVTNRMLQRAKDRRMARDACFCPGCGYSRAGLLVERGQQTCPECGLITAVEASQCLKPEAPA